MKSEKEIKERLQKLYSRREKFSKLTDNDLENDENLKIAKEVVISEYTEKISELEWVLN